MWQQCTRCKRYKPLWEFANNQRATETKLWLNYHCKACGKKSQAEKRRKKGIKKSKTNKYIQVRLFGTSDIKYYDHNGEQVYYKKKSTHKLSGGDKVWNENMFLEAVNYDDDIDNSLRSDGNHVSLQIDDIDIQNIKKINELLETKFTSNVIRLCFRIMCRELELRGILK